MGDLVIRCQGADPSMGWVGVVREVRRPAVDWVYPNGESYTVLFLGPTKLAKDRVGLDWFRRGHISPGLSITYLEPLTGRRRRDYWERKMVRMLLAGPGPERS